MFVSLTNSTHEPCKRFDLQGAFSAFLPCFLDVNQFTDRHYLHAKLSVGQRAELSSGNQVRDYLDVAVAGEMIADVALQPEQGVVNICSGVPVTVRQLAERIADQYGRRDLLAFAARPENPEEPAYIVGRRNSRTGMS